MKRNPGLCQQTDVAANAEILADARAALASAERVTVFSGAGLSAESGIATFRDQETDALWARFDPMQLASVEGFTENRQRVIDWYNWRRNKLATARPNRAHETLARHSHLVHITQNVDDLLERAGVPSERIHHLHGSIVRDSCNAACGFEEAIDLSNPPGLRQCPACGDFVRPAVVWFGEVLPEDAWREATALCSRVDCLLVVGTSAMVHPAASLIHAALRAQRTKIIVVNTRPGELSGNVHFELTGPAGSVLPRLLDGLTLSSE